MTPSDQVTQLVVARFLCRRDSELVWKVSPYAAAWAVGRGVQISSALLMTPPQEWVSYRDLSKNELLVHSRHELFQELVLGLIAQLPGEVDKYVGILRPDEYRVLLVYAGREAYDFFVRGHRFGPPPRGKAFRSDLRSKDGSWKRPDNAVRALEKKIARLREAGADTSLLNEELERRRGLVARGEDPLSGEGRNRGPMSAEAAADLLRTQYLGEGERLDGELKPHELDRMNEEGSVAVVGEPYTYYQEAAEISKDDWDSIKPRAGGVDAETGRAVDDHEEAA